MERTLIIRTSERFEMESLNIDLLTIVTFVETDKVLFFVLFFIENGLVFHSLGNNSNEMATLIL